MLVALVLDDHRALQHLHVGILALELRRSDARLFGLDRFALDDIDEPDNTGHLGQNRRPVRVPLEQRGAGFDLLAVRDQDDATIRDLELVEFAFLLVQQGDLTKRAGGTDDPMLSPCLSETALMSRY